MSHCFSFSLKFTFKDEEKNSVIILKLVGLRFLALSGCFSHIIIFSFFSSRTKVNTTQVFLIFSSHFHLRFSFKFKENFLVKQSKKNLIKFHKINTNVLIKFYKTEEKCAHLYYLVHCAVCRAFQISKLSNSIL